MIEYNTYEKIKRFEKHAEEFGFIIAPYRYTTSSSNEQLISLMPAGDKYPVYARDAQLCTGTVEELEMFMYGLQWMEKYLTMINATDKPAIQRKEQDVLNQQLMKDLSK